MDNTEQVKVIKQALDFGEVVNAAKKRAERKKKERVKVARSEAANP